MVGGWIRLDLLPRKPQRANWNRTAAAVTPGGAYTLAAAPAHSAAPSAACTFGPHTKLCAALREQLST